MSVETHVHGPGRQGTTPTFEARPAAQGPQCSYCGSYDWATALRLFQTPQTHWSGADWKYGWPHKFYLGPGKFYNIHLKECSPEQIAEWNRVTEPLTGIHWLRKEDELHYVSIPGLQRSGVIPDSLNWSEGAESAEEMES